VYGEKNLMTTVLDADPTTTTVETIIHKWFTRLTRDAFREDGDYEFNEWHEEGVNWSREKMLTTMENEFGAGSKKGVPAYQLRAEGVIRTSYTTVEEDGFIVKTFTEVPFEGEFPIVYRTFEEYNATVLAPRAAAKKARDESGETALQLAYSEESAENAEREKRGEPRVYDAEKAYFEFMGWGFTSRQVAGEENDKAPVEPVIQEEKPRSIWDRIFN
jgi:hypothetical protein